MTFTEETTMVHKSIAYDSWGYYAEAYDDETEREGRWYGSRSECEAVPVSDIELHPIRDNGVDPFDLACERRHD